MSYHGFGRVSFSIISTPDTESIWCYSYKALQNELNAVCKNHILKKVYADLQGYLESMHQSENYYDFSYMGGSVVLLFDNIAIEIYLHVRGMVQYRKINLWDLKIKNRKDFPPTDMGLVGSSYFYDMAEQFELSFEGQRVTEVLVDRTDCYPFDLEGFDVQKAEAAEKTNSLPYNIHFNLESGVDFGIYADDIEYFYIELC